ncbi:hypothetical protein SCHPADRAFT_617001 [Schizopora paradoxa]|uniref:Uncharacterized protein n=1 Tax=Schizopora paradoxa TaxID=27342 RepID=A0A0H2R8J5_9AGAM|nr:hypothetical protein SCHPADRAFT_617001 [Schizopora paradoxa]
MSSTPHRPSWRTATRHFLVRHLLPCIPTPTPTPTAFSEKNLSPLLFDGAGRLVRLAHGQRAITNHWQTTRSLDTECDPNVAEQNHLSTFDTRRRGKQTKIKTDSISLRSSSRRRSVSRCRWIGYPIRSKLHRISAQGSLNPSRWGRCTCHGILWIRRERKSQSTLSKPHLSHQEDYHQHRTRRTFFSSKAFGSPPHFSPSAKILPGDPSITVQLLDPPSYIRPTSEIKRALC